MGSFLEGYVLHSYKPISHSLQLPAPCECCRNTIELSSAKQFFSLRQYMKMNLLRMSKIFIYKISDIDTNYVNLPFAKVAAGPHFWGQILAVLSCQCKSILDVFKLQKQPSTLTIPMDFKRDNYCVQIIEIRFTLKPPTFPSNLAVQSLV